MPPDAAVRPDAAFVLPDAALVPPDAAMPPDASTRPDAAFVPPDAATPPPPDAGTGTLLFSDSFTRSVSSGLGSGWQTIAGAWRVASNTAQSASSPLDAARVISPSCADCESSVDVTSNGATVGVLVRSSASGLDRYQLVLLPSGQLQIQRVVAGVATTLGSASSGLIRLDVAARLGLSASGAGPVNLVASVDGVPRLSAMDTTGSALRSAGSAGMGTDTANVAFDNFELWSLAPSSIGQPDAGVLADAGSPPGLDAGAPAGSLAGVTVTYTNTSYELMAVDSTGAAYAVPFASPSAVYASPDGRSWTYRGSAPGGGSFRVMAALADGTLLADTSRGGGTYLARSTDGGAHWAEVLALGDFRMLTPHSVAEVGGEVFLLEYQSFTTADTPIRLWASRDSGQTWSVRFTFTGHRHGHGLAADPAHSALWAYLGDTTAQCGTFRSLDGGRSWTLMLSGQEGDIVDATVLGDGSLLFGQDISYLPNLPHVARLTWSGAYSELVQLSGPSYSIHALRGGGFVAGAAREPGADIYPPSEVSAHLYLSADGVQWVDVLRYRRIDANQNARIDVYWELRTGELVLRMENVDGAGTGGRGYQLLRPERR
ncbi:MAG: sialidase family protein [Myxococcales bacterium]